MRVINHLFRKKVKRDDDDYVFDPGLEMEKDMKRSGSDIDSDFSNFIEDRPKEDAYSDISEFINGN
jgi:hypothetical protein